MGLSTCVQMDAQIPLGESTGIDAPGQLWDRFHEEKANLLPLLDPSIELGLAYGAEPEKGIFHYFAGAKLRKESLPHKGFVTQTLPRGEYVVCRIEAENFLYLVTEALDKASQYLFDIWLPKHWLAPTAFAAEKYFRNGENEMELWVKPTKISD